MNERTTRTRTVDESERIRNQIDTLRSEHRQLKQALGQFESRLWLSNEEQVERKNLQKLKLLKKDQIAALSMKLRALD